MQQVVIVGGGFAGFHAARRLCAVLEPGVEVILVNPTDYFLYVPLLPHVMSGVLDPRRVTISIPRALPAVKLLTGTVTGVDLEQRQVRYVELDGSEQTVGYDQVLIASGSVNKLLPIPGVAEHAHGFRNLAEAVYLRDHLVRQIEVADSTDDTDTRHRELTFVVVGAGYTGTEVAAHGARLTRRLLARHPRLAGHSARWLLLDTASRVLPGLSEKLARIAHRSLTDLGVDVRLGTSVEEATSHGVRLSDGATLPTRSLIWCVGVRPDPLVSTLGLETDNGRLVVEATLAVPGHPAAWACGDAAAVPDLTRPGETTAMTAQHAQRQGVRAANNIAAALAGRGAAKPYKHRNLGFVVDLGGTAAAADPLGVTLGGLPAAAVTRGYHLAAMPGNRVRTAVEWAEHALLGPQELQLNLVKRADVPLETSPPGPR